MSGLLWLVKGEKKSYLTVYKRMEEKEENVGEGEIWTFNAHNPPKIMTFLDYSNKKF